MKRVLLFVLMILCVGVSQAGVINIDCDKAGEPANTFSGQGAYADPGNDFWNSAPAGEATNLLESDGTTATGVGISTSSGSSQDSSPTGSGLIPHDMMGDYNYTRDSDSTISITGLAASTDYFVYAYLGGDNTGQITTLTLNGVTVAQTSADQSGDYVEGETGNYFVMEITTDATGAMTGTFDAVSGRYGAIRGFQITEAVNLGAAHDPTPANNSTIPSYDVLSTPDPDWLSPLQEADGSAITDSNILSVDKYEVWWGVGAEPNYLPGSPDSPYDNGTSQTYDLAAAGEDAIDYETTYYWRVDTTVTVDNNDLQPQVLIEGSTWNFTTEPAYTPPVIETYNSVITTTEIGEGNLSATITGNSDAIPGTGVVWTLLTDDAAFPAGAVWTLNDTTTDTQNPTATLTTDMAGAYKVELVVDDGSGKEGSIQEALAEVDVYADACEAAKDAPSDSWEANYFDVTGPVDPNAPDCIVNVLDFAKLAIDWLNDTTMGVQEEYETIADYVPQDVFDTRIEAEWVDPNDPNACSDGPISDTTGIRIEEQENASGGQATGYANDVAWVEYTIDVPALAVGTPVDVYAAHALNGTGNTETLSFGTAVEGEEALYGEGTLDGTGGWTNFTDGRKIGEVTFTASGSQIVRISYSGGLNLDWFSFDF